MTNFIYRLSVFTDSDGSFGDKASVVIDESGYIDEAERRALTRKLGTGETLFINSLDHANVSIMHYDGEIDFAGVAVLGGAWLFAKLRDKSANELHSKGGPITVWQEADVTWVRARLAAMPPWHHEQLESVEAIEHLEHLTPDTGVEHTMFWAWIDEGKGLIRARTFASDWGIPEAEGNGSGAMVLAAQLGRAIEIHHGKGSVIFAKPTKNNQADLGGRVVRV